MGKNVLLVFASILLSLLTSTILGRVALRFTSFGHMVSETRLHAQNEGVEPAMPRRADPFASTIHMIRLVTFVLDPITAVIVGLFVGLLGGKTSGWLAAIGILPLALYATFTNPWLWEGAVAGLIDITFASATARFLYQCSKLRASSRSSVGPASR